MINRNIICLDTETSGLDPDDGCEIVQIYATAINYADLTIHHAGSFSAIIKPENPDKAQPGALRVIGDLWAKANNEGLQNKVVFKKFLEWCESVNDGGKSAMTKPIFIAYNKDFDSKFVRKQCIDLGLIKKSKWGWEFPWSFEFDAMGFAYLLFESDPSVTDLKLDTILGRCNMSRDNTSVHSAKEDVELLTEWLIRVMKFCREARKRMQISKE